MPGVVHHRDGVLGEGVDADVLGVGRALGAAGAAVVPGDDVDAALGVEQRRPAVGVGAQPVAQQHGRSADVVGPRLEPGAVAAGHLVEAQRQPVVDGRDDVQGLCWILGGSGHVRNCALPGPLTCGFVAEVTAAARRECSGDAASAEPGRWERGRRGTGPASSSGEHRVDELLCLVPFSSAGGQRGRGHHRVATGLALAVLRPSRQREEQWSDELVHDRLPVVQRVGPERPVPRSEPNARQGWSPPRHACVTGV